MKVSAAILRKGIPLCLCAALLCTALSGCGKKSDTNAEAESYTTTVTYSEDTAVSGAVYTSTGADENAILITDGAVTLDNITVIRDSADSTGGDDASFYGVGAAILVTGGNTTITNANITTDAKGGAGVFAYGDGVVAISDSTITTAQNTSGGIHAAGGGTLYATNVTATTQGESSAAIRSDRGGGLMVVSGGEYTSNGVGSPAVYCTATIAVENTELTANGSEAVCIEGLNSLYLYDCELSGNMSDSSQNDCTWNVILYQSMSGDSQIGNSTFQMSGGTLTAQNGGMFYTTNTESTFILNDVEIVYAGDSAFFLRCTGNHNQRGWGSEGANGADCIFTAIDQDMTGDVVWDSISQLDFYMTDGSTLTGAFVQDESCAGSGGSGYANLYIEAGSEWIVTGDSVLTALHQGGSITDETGKTVTVKGTDGTVYVNGTSGYTVTVSSYGTSVDLSSAGTITAFEDAQVNNGSQISGGPDGGGTPPELPDGAMDDGQPPAQPNGDRGSGGTPPSRPDGSEQPPAMPENGAGNSGAPPELPEDANSGTPPDLPSGVMNNGGTPPDLPSGAMENGGTPPELPSGGVENRETPPDLPNGGIGQPTANGGGMGGAAPPDMPGGNN